MAVRNWGTFINIVNHHFRYLETKFRFTQISTEIPFIIYESSFFNISIFWEPGGRYELGLSIDFNKKPDKYYYPLHLDDLVKFHNSSKVENTEWLLIDTKEKLETGIKEISDILRKYGRKLLMGDLDEIKRVQKLIER